MVKYGDKDCRKEKRWQIYYAKSLKMIRAKLKTRKTAKKVESYADAMAALSDEELQAKTEEFKQRYQNGKSRSALAGGICDCS